MRCWYFSAADVLPNDDGRKIVIGETLTVEGEIVPCERGLHASASAYDALMYAPGPLLWRVELGGTIVAHGDPVDKFAASKRTTLAGGIDVTAALREFARWCALQVIHLWDAPDVVRQYLETGDESLRAAAAGAAGAAAWDAAREARTAAAGAAGAAAWAAAREARDAAAGAARAAAGAAAWEARTAAAWDAWDAARAARAAWAAQRAKFEEICERLIPLEVEHVG